VTATVSGNVAAAQVIPRSFLTPSITTWLNAAGRPIMTVHEAVPQLSRATPKAGSGSRSVTVRSGGTGTRIRTDCSTG
jgi:hypothetical protein